mgnify:CR=1 FL=1
MEEEEEEELCVEVDFNENSSSPEVPTTYPHHIVI